MPFGRSAQDVDIFGIDERGKEIVAQVTFSTAIGKIRQKAAMLAKYSGRRIFFSPGLGITERFKQAFPEVEFISTETVWDWLAKQKRYRTAMFSRLG